MQNYVVALQRKRQSRALDQASLLGDEDALSHLKFQP